MGLEGNCLVGARDGEEVKLAKWADVSLKGLERHEEKFECQLMGRGESLTVLKEKVMGSHRYFRDKTGIRVKGGMEKAGGQWEAREAEGLL